MRTRSKGYFKRTDSDSQDKDKLNTEQALFYMRHLWSILPQTVKDSCIYIDPMLISLYQKDLSTRKNAIRWFNRKDYFSKKYVFLPACLWNHWVLVIICNPGGDLNDKSERPSIVILDSLKGSSQKDIGMLMQSLMFQLYKDRATSKSVINKIPILSPDVPKQQDNKKCGFFVLYYMTLFLKTCPEKFTTSGGYPFFMTKSWFTLEDFKEYESKLAKILITKGFIISGTDIDQDTINFIRSCLRDEVQYTDSSAGNGHRNRKRNRDEESKSTSILELTESEDETSDAFVDEEDIRMNSNSITGHRKLLMKLNPNVFDKVVENLTNEQRDWVNKTGFGDLLAFRMSYNPVILGYKLVSNLNTDEMSLTVDGKKFKITENDVNNILGLPRGNRKVEFLGGVDFRRRWRSQFMKNKTCFRVCITTVIERMSETKNLTWNFKMNYLCYIITMLIEQPANSYIRQTVCGFSGQLDNCSRYNWCAYLLEKLKETHTTWERDRATHNYTGSLAFLVYFFLDRIVGEDVIDEKSSPRYIDWTQYSLKKIQDYFIEMDCLSGNEIKIPYIDRNILNSWKHEESEEESYESNQNSVEEDISTGQSSKTKDKFFRQDKAGVDESDCTATKNVNKDVGDMLKKSMDKYKKIQNDILDMLETSKRNGQINVADVDLKNRFVEMNNIANWVAEDAFNSQSASAYVDKLNKFAQGIPGNQFQYGVFLPK